MCDDQNSGPSGDSGLDLNRREVLASLVKYSAAVAGASTVLLTASSSVSLASVSGGEGGGRGENPRNNKPVGNASFDGPRGQVPSGRDA